VIAFVGKWAITWRVVVRGDRLLMRGLGAMCIAKISLMESTSHDGSQP
jgi:hypothetical protein